jgi:hypothetical protein
MNQLLIGAIIMACLTITLFFLRFWWKTRDRFFLYFAASFFTEGVNRTILGLTAVTSEAEPCFLLIRLLSLQVIQLGNLFKYRANWSR